MPRKRARVGPNGRKGRGLTACPRGHTGQPRKLYLRSYDHDRGAWHPVAVWCPGCALAYNVLPTSHKAAAARAGRPLRGQLRLRLTRR